jgi:hypothetical protein
MNDDRDMEEIDDLLIATTRLVLTLKQGIVTSVHHGFGPYYGITWDEKYIYLVARGAQRVPRFTGMEKILVLKPNFDWIGEFQGLQLFKLHQIHYFNEQLFICNTGRNTLDIVTGKAADDEYATNPLGSINYAIQKLNMDPGKDPLPARALAGDSLWINSVWTNEDGIYVVEHRRGPSKIKHINTKFELLGEQTGMGDKMHNVYIEDGKMIVCSSEAGCIIIRDLSTGKDKTIDTSRYDLGIPRGLARTEDRWYIGISKRVPRGERHLALDGAVLAFDDEFNLIHKTILKNVGQVHEIRAMTGLDRAHNGIPFPKEMNLSKEGNEETGFGHRDVSSINLKGVGEPPYAPKIWIPRARA